MGGPDTALLESLFGLSGKRALVTGASSGIGAHLAQTLGRAGATVVLAARRESNLSSLHAHMTAAGLDAEVVVLDVTDPASVDRLPETVGALDILINNSGVSAEAPLADMDAQDWDHVFDTNLKGAWLVSRALTPALRRSEGTILNVASILGLGVLKTVGAYAASKAGLIQLTRAMALELARDNVRVNALAPGYIETPINTAFFASEAGQKMLRGVPMRRLGRCADLDAAVLSLVGPGAAFTTGSVVVVDGGHTLSLS